MLKRLHDDLFYAEDEISFYGVHLQTRMSVVRLPDGGLLVISPLLLTEPLKQALDALGPVRHIASPNKIHNQGLTPFAEAYPDAKLWASPGLIARRPDLGFAGTLGDVPHPDWAPVLDQLVTEGNVFFAEVVFFHAASRTLIVADLIENLTDQTIASTAAQQLAKAMKIFGKPLPSPEFRMYTDDAQAAVVRLDKIAEWDFTRILMAHGEIITENAHDVLRHVRDFLSAEVNARSSHRAALYRFLAAKQ